VVVENVAENFQVRSNIQILPLVPGSARGGSKESSSSCGRLIAKVGWLGETPNVTLRPLETTTLFPETRFVAPNEFLH
jgi:hypothetical protein